MRRVMRFPGQISAQELQEREGTGAWSDEKGHRVPARAQARRGAALWPPCGSCCGWCIRVAVCLVSAATPLWPRRGRLTRAAAVLGSRGGRRVAARTAPPLAPAAPSRGRCGRSGHALGFWAEGPRPH